MFLNFLFVLASNSFCDSDRYPYPGTLPEAFEQGSIQFTVPAIQGMQRHQVSPETVIKIATENPNENLVYQGVLCFAFDQQSEKKRLIGLW